jgi:ABC-type antimicrobial peptide transport system permease subunit
LAHIYYMQDFGLYFELGWQHICDWQGYDHILFVTVLCGTYQLTDWRKVLVLVTAFTIGHSVTLALSALRIISVNTSLIEFLIPVTIVLTSLINILNKQRSNNTVRLSYILALLFGLIHGLGFSNYLKSLLGTSTNVTAQLFAFNIGLEFGQVLIVLAVLLIAYVIINLLKTPRREWVLFLSSAIFGIAFIMCIERFLLIRFR